MFFGVIDAATLVTMSLTESWFPKDLNDFIKYLFSFKFASLLCLWHLWQEPTCYETYHKTQKFHKTSRNFFNFPIFYRFDTTRRAIIQKTFVTVWTSFDMLFLKDQCAEKLKYIFEFVSKMNAWIMSKTRVCGQIYADTWFFTLPLKWNLSSPPLHSRQCLRKKFNRTEHKKNSLHITLESHLWVYSVLVERVIEKLMIWQVW